MTRLRNLNCSIPRGRFALLTIALAFAASPLYAKPTSVRVPSRCVEIEGCPDNESCP